MADDLDRKIKQIADMFGVSDTKSLRNIVDNISSNSAPSNERDSSEANASDEEENAVPTFSPYSQSSGRGRNNTLDILSKANEMLNMFNNISDSRIALLHSVQPFLRPERKQRLDNAVQLLKIISVISALTNNRNNTKG